MSINAIIQRKISEAQSDFEVSAREIGGIIASAIRSGVSVNEVDAALRELADAASGVAWVAPSVIADIAAEMKENAQIQFTLRQFGYDVAVDGLMGATTRSAISQFQARQRLPVTGTMNGQTIEAMCELTLEIQELLQHAGYAIANDGVFGKKTAAALRDFMSLERDALVSNDEWRALHDSINWVDHPFRSDLPAFSLHVTGFSEALRPKI